jgi:hypothetical protein
MARPRRAGLSDVELVSPYQKKRIREIRVIRG